jgi:hypothetical protein
LVQNPLIWIKAAALRANGTAERRAKSARCVETYNAAPAEYLGWAALV